MPVLGYVTSLAPIKTGTQMFPKVPHKTGIIRKNIISNPCKVVIKLYVEMLLLSIILLPPCSNSSLIITLVIVPDTPASIPTHPYCIPMFL